MTESQTNAAVTSGPPPICAIGASAGGVRALLNFFGAINDDLGMPFDPTDYSVVVKLRAPPPNPWRWEIYRAGRANAVEQAPVFFPTMAAAGRAGKVALKQLLDGRAAARGSVLWGLRPPVGPIAKPN